MTEQKGRASRIIGLDVHPDSFAGAILRGRDPATAQIESTSTRVALPQLESWAERHTSAEDVLGLGSQRQRFCSSRAAENGRKKSGDSRQPPGRESGKGLLCQ